MQAAAIDLVQLDLDLACGPQQLRSLLGTGWYILHQQVQRKPVLHDTVPIYVQSNAGDIVQTNRVIRVKKTSDARQHFVCSWRQNAATA
jgi:hypothetical protein